MPVCLFELWFFSTVTSTRLGTQKCVVVHAWRNNYFLYHFRPIWFVKTRRLIPAVWVIKDAWSLILRKTYNTHDVTSPAMPSFHLTCCWHFSHWEVTSLFSLAKWWIFQYVYNKHNTAWKVLCTVFTHSLFLYQRSSEWTSEISDMSTTSA